MFKNPKRILFVWCREQNICPYRGGFCDRKSCSWVDFKGNIVLCPHFRGGNNFTRKRGISH